MIDVAIANEQSTLAVDEDRLRRAVAMVLGDAEIAEATVSVAVVDDPTIHRLNRQYLDHDYATDVLSFLLDRDERSLDGEVVVSADTAASCAGRYGWSAEDELLLYVVHGMLHLVGYDDGEPEERAEMRSQERACLERFGMTPPVEEMNRTTPSRQRGMARGGKRAS